MAKPQAEDVSSDAELCLGPVPPTSRGCSRSSTCTITRVSESWRSSAP